MRPRLPSTGNLDHIVDLLIDFYATSTAVAHFALARLSCLYFVERHTATMYFCEFVLSQHKQL